MRLIRRLCPTKPDVALFTSLLRNAILRPWHYPIANLGTLSDRCEVMASSSDDEKHVSFPPGSHGDEPSVTQAKDETLNGESNGHANGHQEKDLATDGKAVDDAKKSGRPPAEEENERSRGKVLIIMLALGVSWMGADTKLWS